jgi:hypothetical protein
MAKRDFRVRKCWLVEPVLFNRFQTLEGVKNWIMTVAPSL